MERILNKTFSVHHSPNCPSPWLVRMCGFHRAVIDGRPANTTGDRLGYGKTLKEAVTNVLAKRRDDGSAEG